MNNDQLWNYLLTPSGIIVSMIIYLRARWDLCLSNEAI